MHPKRCKSKSRVHLWQLTLTGIDSPSATTVTLAVERPAFFVESDFFRKETMTTTFQGGD